jgi:hypothetical protein
MHCCSQDDDAYLSRRLLVFGPFIYALLMTTRGGQPFQIGRFVLHVIVGGLAAAALSAAGLFAWLWPLLPRGPNLARSGWSPQPPLPGR